MRLTVLGSAGWMPSSGRETACYAVQDGSDLLLLDGGTGIRRLVTSPEYLFGIKRIVIALSHFHLDHTIGLTYLFALPVEIEVAIYGPGEWLYSTPTRTVLQDLLRSPFLSKSLADLGADVHELHDGYQDLKRWPVVSRAQREHPQPSVGFRVDDRISYITDTALDPGTVPFVEGSELLIHEAWFESPGGEVGHSSVNEACKCASESNAARLLLCHLNPATTAPYFSEAARDKFPAAMVADDGRQISL